jgi:hypothetical protein
MKIREKKERDFSILRWHVPDGTREPPSTDHPKLSCNPPYSPTWASRRLLQRRKCSHWSPPRLKKERCHWLPPRQQMRKKRCHWSLPRRRKEKRRCHASPPWRRTVKRKKRCHWSPHRRRKKARRYWPAADELRRTQAVADVRLAAVGRERTAGDRPFLGSSLF